MTDGYVTGFQTSEGGQNADFDLTQGNQRKADIQMSIEVHPGIVFFWSWVTMPYRNAPISKYENKTFFGQKIREKSDL